MAREDAKDIRTVTVTDADGQQLEKFEFGCKGIRSLKGMIQGLWSLNPFSEGLSGRNGFSDADAHTEIDGRGLVLEFKQSFRSLNKGQVMKAIRQAKFQKTTTIFVEGETDCPTRVVVIAEDGVEGSYRTSIVQDVTLADVQDMISRWEKWARANSLVKGNKTDEWDAVNKFIAESRATVNKKGVM